MRVVYWILLAAACSAQTDEQARTEAAPVAIASASERVLRGRVVDADTNTPVADASIAPLQESDGGRERELTRSRADGTFEIVIATDDWDGAGIAVRKSGYCGSALELADPYLEAFDDEEPPVRDEPAFWELSLLRECVLEGTVTRTDGTPVAGATIEVFQSGSSLEEFGKALEADSIDVDDPDALAKLEANARRPQLTWETDGASRTATTDADGTYRIDGLCARLSCGAPRLTTAGSKAEGKRVTFARAGETQRLDWTIPTQFGALEGRVTVNGRIPSASVAWSSGIFADRMFETNDDGTYRFTGVPAGEVELVVDLGWSGFEPHVERVVVATDATTTRDVALTVDFARIHGVVTLCCEPTADEMEQLLKRAARDRSALDDAFPRLDPTGLRVVATRPRDGATVATIVAPDGAFTFALPDAEPDPWTITIDDPRVDASNRRAREKSHSGATAVRVTAWAVGND